MDQRFQTGLVKRRPALPEIGDPFLIGIETDDLIARLGQTSGRDAAEMP